jgi:MEMO1 family protein
MYRRPARVAGQFYSANPAHLEEFLKETIPQHTVKKKVRGVIMPHAGYVYSGTTAALTIAEVEIPDTVLLLGPNHTGRGFEFSLLDEGVWETPLGNVSVNSVLSRELLRASPLLRADTTAHRDEHSLEVELPFLQFLNKHVTIVPLTISSDNLEECTLVGKTIARCIQGKDVLMLASTDMSHYVTQAVAEQKDKEAIAAILALDEKALAQKVLRLNITMCGFIPVFILLVAAKTLGATQCRLVDYRTSGEVSGDFNQVVGYAGMIIE